MYIMTSRPRTRIPSRLRLRVAKQIEDVNEVYKLHNLPEFYKVNVAAHSALERLRPLAFSGSGTHFKYGAAEYIERNKRLELAGELLEREVNVHLRHAQKLMVKAMPKDLYPVCTIHPIEQYLDVAIITNPGFSFSI
ncbi:DNA-directed RNA polymerases IV and V subunit 2-like protein [Tanacetum coccineum]